MCPHTWAVPLCPGALILQPQHEPCHSPALALVLDGPWTSAVALCPTLSATAPAWAPWVAPGPDPARFMQVIVCEPCFPHLVQLGWAPSCSLGALRSPWVPGCRAFTRYFQMRTCITNSFHFYNKNYSSVKIELHVKLKT